MFKELATLFALCAGSLLSLLLIGRLLQLRELFLSQNLGFWDIGQMFLYLSPFFLLLIIPIACMLSVFLTLLRMNTDLETTALRASGVSLYQLLPAPLVLGVLCTIAAWWISFYGLAWGMENFRSTVLDIARSKTQVVMKPGVFNRDFPGLTLYAQQVDSASGQLSTVFVKDASHDGTPSTILAPHGAIRTDTEKGQIVFQLENGKIYREEADGMSVIGFGTYKVRMDLSKMVGGYSLGSVRPKEMSWEKLNALDDKHEANGVSDNYARQVKVEIQKRLVLPLACFILGLFAVPLASMFSGLHRHWGLLLALGFFLTYYTLLSLGLSLGETGAIAPVVGLWMPDALFFLAGLYGLRQAAKERSIPIMQWLSHLKFSRRKAENVS